MPNTNPESMNDEHLRREALASKRRVRKRLEAMLDAQIEPATPDATDSTASLHDELRWKDPSHSGEFEAVLN